MVTFIRSDLDFILQQIIIAERQANGESLLDLIPNVDLPYGLRTVDGSLNNLVIGQNEFGSADDVFPRLGTAQFLPAEFGTSYAQTSGTVIDSQPRVISNLIVDQTANNPAAIAVAAQTPGGQLVTSPGLDGVFGTADDTQVNFIPNQSPDLGLSAPFNEWFTFFGQFFDHGLDLVTKGGVGTVFIPLKPDDPLFDPTPGAANFMIETRATVTMLPGPDGILGTADDTRENQNTTTPFVDQNQTYSSHPSHQVFLRAYAIGPDGHPHATGKLIENLDLGPDGHFGTADDTPVGGMATWAVVKAQARDILGINLTDKDFDDVPLLATDAYGNFVKGAHGMPQVVMITPGADGIFGTADDGSHLVEADRAAPLDLTHAVRTGHQFLIDVNHDAVPVFDAAGNLAPDADNIAGNAQPFDPATGQNLTYDDELLNAHYIAGDGRVNENIGLTAVHSIFHSEHNRLVDATKNLILSGNDLDFLNQWLLAPVAAVPTTQTQIDALQWNGERLFQAAKFGTEMQYQHLVFEEFARTLVPAVDEFLAPNGYDTTIDPSIFAEFAHAVFRLGHSMLTETVDRFDPNFNLVDPDPTNPFDQQLGLIKAFLNPLEFAASGPTPAEATGALVRGLTREVGNEIDEFVTEAVRNNLLGLPLDLAALNIARGRDTGLPSLNGLRAQIQNYAGQDTAAGDSVLKPYVSWADYAAHMQHPESLVNFIAAYGTHPLITAATTVDAKRAAAMDIVFETATSPLDRLDFLNSTGDWADDAGTHTKDSDGVTTTGLGSVDLWVGGLAEATEPFGSMLGSTFQFVFETQLENLQNGDRFYYLSRTAGMNFGNELEANSFSDLVMANTDATHLPANIFSTPAWILEIDPTKQHTGLGLDGRADPTFADDQPPAGTQSEVLASFNHPTMINGIEVAPLVIRDNPDTVGPDTNYLHYTGNSPVVLGGTSGNDILISGASDQDTLWGDDGNDRLDGGAGDDHMFGGAGDDIITSGGGTDVIEGGDGNDVITEGHSHIPIDVPNIILGGAGKDFVSMTDDISMIFGGTGDDFIVAGMSTHLGQGARNNLPETGNEGDDWIEEGTQDGSPGDNMNPFLLDDVAGNDIFVGGGGFDEMIGEGGDDIFVGSDGQDKMDGMSGFDWTTYKDDKFGITVDMRLPLFSPAHGGNVVTNIIDAAPGAAAGAGQGVGQSPDSIMDRFAETEGMSGSRYADIIFGDDQTAAVIAGITAKGSVLTNISLINGLQDFLGAGVTSFGAGNIILGGDGSDLIWGNGGDDLIDGDKWLNVRISVRANADGTGPEIASFDHARDLTPFMVNGTYNPGQLVAVREILPGHGGYDTVNFSGNFADYAITINDGNTPNDISDDVITVTDTRPNLDGSDRLTHIERLQFNDTALILDPSLNNEPVGQLAILDAVSGTPDDTPIEGQVLKVSIAGVTDADNADGTPRGATYVWQSEIKPGVFKDIILAPGRVGVGFPAADGLTFVVDPALGLAGQALRVRAVYMDDHGVTEQAYSAPTTPVAASPVAPVTPVSFVDHTQQAAGSVGVHFIRSDLDFILTQIHYAERNAAGESLAAILPNVRVPFGLRTVDGSDNNLINTVNTGDQTQFGGADTVFPRLTDPVFRPAENGTSYTQTSGTVIDSQPRTISNLIVDQTANNPAAYASAYNPGPDGVLHTADDVLKDGVSIVTSPGLDGQFGTADDRQVFQTDNVMPDAGVSEPFDAWFTFFGQFFDHGLDLVTKGGNGTIFMPLKDDDPLVAGADGVFGTPDDLPPQLRFMVETRATMLPGPDGVLGTADDIHENSNTTTPFVDQNQTYTSHPSHQVFLRAYAVDALDGKVHATGKLIENRNLGPDGHLGTADDTPIGGMATWAVVKAQANDLLGIHLTDKDFDNVPLLATDPYGNYIRGAHGLPQVVMKTAGVDGTFGTADDGTTLVEGNRAAPIDLTHAVRTGHQFLIDVNHNAVPVINAAGNLVPDADSIAGNAQPTDAFGNNLTYDDELLNAHYIAGDGRVNENIGLTTVHSIFHSEHNRLVDQVKNTILVAEQDTPGYINDWVMPGFVFHAGMTADQIDWNGERLFQVAKFGTEMQYQHLVFEEFARTVQPLVDPFFAPTQVYDTNINPAIVAEFAHTVYRFGHSMLTETVDRYDANFNVVGDPNSANPDQQLGLIAAFLNPLAFVGSGDTPREAVSNIVRGITRTTGNEIDEFVTEALRNNLLGTPLDLAVLNIARGRDTGIPGLNEARREFYADTSDSELKPYTSWADFVQNIKHPESLINFIAAYGTHSSITSATTLDAKRAAAAAIVLGGADAPADRLDFLNSHGAWANDVHGVTTTGVDGIDFWVGGLAEEVTPFGGLLGSTFNFVFENQLEKLQDGDRFYYLERTAGLNFNAELENNTFSKLVMANTDVTHPSALIFHTPALTLEVDATKQFNADVVLPGPDGIMGTADDVSAPRADPVNTGPFAALIPLVIRDDPHTPEHEVNYLHYTGDGSVNTATRGVVIGGTPGHDTIISSSGDDSIWGDTGNDRLEGGMGNDQIDGGAGDDIITDTGGDDVIHGEDGNDVIQGGNGLNLLLGGYGQDFIISGEDGADVRGGPGNDFLYGSKLNEFSMGGEGDDWIERGTSDGAAGDNFDPFGNDPINGNDVFKGDGGTDNVDGEGGDDIYIATPSEADRFIGFSGFDWATFKDDLVGVTVGLDSSQRFADQPVVPGSSSSIISRLDLVEGLSGTHFNDYLSGDDAIATVIATAGIGGSVLTNPGLISGLQDFLNAFKGTPATPVVTRFGDGNIILGGEGSDTIFGRGGDDLIDGDAWLNVRISVRAGHDANGPFGPEITSANSMTELIPFMLNGTYNPGQLQVVREILYAPTQDFDTALYQGPLANYGFTVNGVAATAADLVTASSNDIITVTDNVVAGAKGDGTDTLRHIERLQFADQAIVIDGLNNGPTGALTISDTTPAEDQLLTVSIANVHDADNITAANPTGAITGPVTYIWQVEDRPGTGIFHDLIHFAFGEISREDANHFTPAEPYVGGIGLPSLVGLEVRVRAEYQDGHGVLESVFSAATAAVTNVNDPATGGPTISDMTPTEGLPLTASSFGISDPDGITTSVFSYQWQQGALGGGGTFADIVGAVGDTFTPTQDQVNRQLRVVATFVDDHGTTETLASIVPTTVTGDLIEPNALGQLLTGTEGQDIIFGGGGNDTINALGENDVVDGGAGNDIINAGAGNDTINHTAGEGTDTVDGGAGTDRLNVLGTAGNDTVTVRLDPTGISRVDNGVVTGVESFTADLGDGSDTLVYTTALSVSINLANGPSFPGFVTVAGVENVTTGAGNDSLIGTADANALDGGAGNDTLDGGAGNDTLTGRTGNDNISGGDGNDTVNYTFGDGLDTIDGGAGIDRLNITGTAAANVLAVTVSGGVLTSALGMPLTNMETATANLGAGVDTLTYVGATEAVAVDLTAGTASGFITIANIENAIGGAGNDTLRGSTAANTIDGGAGNDTLSGGVGNDNISGGDGDDTINYTFNDGVDALNGGAGSDRLNITGNAAGNVLAVTISAGTLTSALGMSLLNIETATADLLGGVDTLSYASATEAVTVDLGAGTASGFISIAHIENVIGGSGNDTLTDQAGVTNTLTGGGGNDTFFVHETADVASEGANGGIDEVRSFASSYVLSNVNVENLTYVGAGNFTGTGNARDNTVSGGAGNDTLSGQGGNDTLNGGGGTDSLDGGIGNDTLNGDDGNDTLTGGSGNDSVNGGLGDDTVNYLFGDGVDTLDGGGGTDTLNITGTAAANLLAVTISGGVLTSAIGMAMTNMETAKADLQGGVDTLTYAGATEAVHVDLGAGTASGFASIAGIENVSGGSGNDVLADAAGVANVLIGGAGNDTYVVHESADVIVEAGAAGTDEVR
ncbi:peroxidase family protein, partial [Ramlibacter monticola]